MKKYNTVLFFSLFLLLSLAGKSQDVVFCEKVDMMGNAINQSNHFDVSKKGGFFNVLYKQKSGVSFEEVTFDIYHIENKAEVFMSTVKMKVDPNATWFYKEITFFKSGMYRVYLFSEKDKMLGVGKVEIVVDQ